MKQEKLGGIAAIILTLIYVVGIVMQATVLNTSGLVELSEKFAFAKANASLLIAWVSLLYIVFGIVLLTLTVSLNDAIKHHSKFVARLNLGFGVIWSTLVIASGMIHNTGLLQAIHYDYMELFEITQVFHSAIGGNNEIIGGLWMLTIVYSGMKFKLFPNWMNFIGLIAGLAGVLTLMPSLYETFIMVFALGQMLWWVCIGIYLIRGRLSANSGSGQVHEYQRNF